jgi:hypothetical protein
MDGGPLFPPESLTFGPSQNLDIYLHSLTYPRPINILESNKRGEISISFGKESHKSKIRSSYIFAGDYLSVEHFDWMDAGENFVTYSHGYKAPFGENHKELSNEYINLSYSNFLSGSKNIGLVHSANIQYNIKNGNDVQGFQKDKIGDNFEDLEELLGKVTDPITGEVTEIASSVGSYYFTSESGGVAPVGTDIFQDIEYKTPSVKIGYSVSAYAKTDNQKVNFGALVGLGAEAAFYSINDVKITPSIYAGIDTKLGNAMELSFSAIARGGYKKPLWTDEKMIETAAEGIIALEDSRTERKKFTYQKYFIEAEEQGVNYHIEKTNLIKSNELPSYDEVKRLGANLTFSGEASFKISEGVSLSAKASITPKYGSSETIEPYYNDKVFDPNSETGVKDFPETRIVNGLSSIELTDFSGEVKLSISLAEGNKSVKCPKF